MDWDKEIETFFDLYEVCVTQTLESQDKLIGDLCSNVLNILFISLLKLKKDLSKRVLEFYESRENLLINSLLHSKEFQIRKSTQHLISKLISVEEENRNSVFKILLTFLPKLSSELCSSKALFFFNCLKEILSFFNEEHYEKFNLKDLFSFCYNTLKQLPINEPKNCKPEETDETLVGVLQILCISAQKFKQEILNK